MLCVFFIFTLGINELLVMQYVYYIFNFRLLMVEAVYNFRNYCMLGHPNNKITSLVKSS